MQRTLSKTRLVTNYVAGNEGLLLANMYCFYIKGVCVGATWKRIGKNSPLAASVDGYAPYVNTIMPDLHLPFFKGLFELFVDTTLKFAKGDADPKKTSMAALELGLGEFGLKTSDITPYMKEITIFIKNIVTMKPTSFKMIDK